MITIKNVTLNFPALFSLPIINGEQGKKYNTKIILDPIKHKAAIALLQKTIDERTAEYPEVNGKPVKLPADKLCLRNGDDLGKEEYEGMMVLSASNKKRPIVVNKAREPITEDDEMIYSGCIGHVNVDVWKQPDKKFGKRINCELLAFQWTAEGTRIGGSGVTRDAAMQGFDSDEDFG